MSNLHLVTGYAGQAHVTAADDGSFNTAIFGSGEYVFDIGSKFAASVVSNNKITIADGDLLMQGRHVRLNEGTTVALTINNGTQGKLRNDLIVARYTKDSVSGVEQVNLVVIQGTAVDSNPADPAYTSGDIINDHALLNDMPLYRIPLNGLTVGTPVAMFSTAAVQIKGGGTGGTTVEEALDNLVNGQDIAPASVDNGVAELSKSNAGNGQVRVSRSSGAENASMTATGTYGGLVTISDLSGKNNRARMSVVSSDEGRLTLWDSGNASHILSPESIDKANSAVSITQLWTNSSPTSTFSEQSITKDLSEYQLVLVIAQYHPAVSGYGGRNVSVITAVGDEGLLIYAWGNTGIIAHRRFYTTISGVTFDSCYRDKVSDTPDDTYVIPQYIYGIKGVK